VIALRLSGEKKIFALAVTNQFGSGEGDFLCALASFPRSAAFVGPR
jgi:hypothetical protein